jgi:hypothetical protein
MGNATKHVGTGDGGSVEVWSGYAREVADNGRGADARCTLYVAPAVSSPDQYLYMETNGDPVMIGWLEDGEVRLNEAQFVGAGGRVVDLNREDMRWVREAIESEYSLA